jgi:hypothetical protein
MDRNRISPEKITHPFQLMAAWFVMLILLVSALLTGAANIDTPTWIPGFLCISAVLLAVFVMTCVLLMLTRFRPHLQGPKEYAEWLKDERRYSGQSVSQLSIREITSRPQHVTTALGITDDPVFLKEIISHHISVSKLEGADRVVGVLRSFGFNAESYRVPVQHKHLHQDDNKTNHEAIWIGTRVPPRVALLVIKSVLDIWSHLKYMHLSSDGTDFPPDYIHDQLYLGGATSTAKRYGLQPWSTEQIKAIPDSITIDEFHKLVRAKYAKGTH